MFRVETFRRNVSTAVATKWYEQLSRGIPMSFFKNKFRIESTRLQGWDYSRVGLYFVTICTREHAYFFGEIVNSEMQLSPIGEIVAEEWQKTPLVRPNVELDTWIIMPNHLHAIVVITHQMPISKPDGVETFRRNVSTNSNAPTARLRPNTLGSIIGQYKSVCTKRIWAAGFRNFGWQPRFYDHIIRNEKSLQKIREYVINNPLRWEEDRNNAASIYM